MFALQYVDTRLFFWNIFVKSISAIKMQISSKYQLDFDIWKSIHMLPMLDCLPVNPNHLLKQLSVYSPMLVYESASDSFFLVFLVLSFFVPRLPCFVFREWIFKPQEFLCASFQCLCSSCHEIFVFAFRNQFFNCRRPLNLSMILAS